MQRRCRAHASQVQIPLGWNLAVPPANTTERDDAKQHAVSRFGAPRGALYDHPARNRRCKTPPEHCPGRLRRSPAERNWVSPRLLSGLGTAWLVDIVIACMLDATAAQPTMV